MEDISECETVTLSSTLVADAILEASATRPMDLGQANRRECDTVGIDRKRMESIITRRQQHATSSREPCARVKSSFFLFVEPIFFNKMFWTTLAEARWIVLLGRACKGFSRSDGMLMLPAMYTWREFALSSLIDMAVHVSPEPDSKVLADAIKMAPSNASVLECCQALLDITPSCAGDAYQRMREENGREWQVMEDAYVRIGETHGGIKAVLTAMRKWPESALVQSCGCRFLRLVGRIETNMIEIGKENGISIVLSALKAHRHNVDVQHYGCWALMNLAYNSGNRSTISAEGGIEVLLDSLERHAAHTGVQELGCWGLSNIACSEESSAIISEKQGTTHIIRAMNMHPTSSAIQEGGISVLLRLKWSGENRDDARALGGVDVVARALVAHRSNPGIQTKGFALIQRFQQLY